MKTIALKLLKGQFLVLLALLSVILSSEITAQSTNKPEKSCVQEVPCDKLDLMISDLQKASIEHKQYQNLQVSQALISAERNFLKDANQLLEKDRDNWKTKAQKRNLRLFSSVSLNVTFITIIVLLL